VSLQLYSKTHAWVFRNVCKDEWLLQHQDLIRCDTKVIYRKAITVACRDTWDRSLASPMFLVDGPSIQLPPID